MIEERVITLDEKKLTAAEFLNIFRVQFLFIACIMCINSVSSGNVFHADFH